MELENLPKAYDPTSVEDGIYAAWEKSGAFSPSGDGEPYCIVMPPPNRTGTLHMGHATMLAIEDLLIRFHRMQGKRALWIPGTDHAAIATQVKVEQLLMKQGMKNPREELGREKFLAKVVEFADESANTIRNQVRKMGSSCDWSRECYTLDDERGRAVNEMFKMMVEDGIIERGYRVVNWDPQFQTTLSDDEVESKDVKAKLLTFKYDKDFPITISTTRPETKFGDTAVAVHPDDKRYKKFVGKTFEPVFCGKKLSITIIADEAVDPAFGTGALGVTPAHSMIDAEIAERNTLPTVQVIGRDGTMMDGLGDFSGLSVVDARKKIEAALQDAGLLEKVEEVDQALPVAQRGGAPVEQLPMRQWFIRVNKKFALRQATLRPPSAKATGGAPTEALAKVGGWKKGAKVTLKELMIEAVKSKQTNIVPERFDKTYFHWINNLRDWCISRQIWFGHRIPVWYRSEPSLTPPSQGGATDSDSPPYEGGVRGGSDGWVISETSPGSDWEQDPDTLDTWFSSGLWTFSTLGWPITNTIGFHKDLVALVKSGEKTKTFRLRDQGVLIGETCNLQNTQTKKNVGYLKIKSICKTTIKELEFNQDGHEKYKDKAHFVGTMSEYYPNVRVNDHTDVFVYEFEYKEEPDLKTFHPTAVLETGYDILFFWVARMILMSTYALGEVPFKDVYLHGLVRDEQGRKMSKSLGNVLDPLDLIPKYGTDAVRLSLVMGTTPGQDVKLSEPKIEGFRNFTNKLWNISRFILTQTVGAHAMRPVQPKTLADHWILARVAEVSSSVTKKIETYQFSSAGEELRDFTWGDLADWYLEIAKIQIKTVGAHGDASILSHILETILKLWHPFMPFVTESIWKTAGFEGQLIAASWPTIKSPPYEGGARGGSGFESIRSLVTDIRRLRADQGIEPVKILEIALVASSEMKKLVEENIEIVKTLARVSEISFVKEVASGWVTTVSGSTTIGLDLAGTVDVEKEVAKLEKEITETESYLASLTQKLKNKEFLAKAPTKVKEDMETKYGEAELKLKALKERLGMMRKGR